MFPFVSFFRGGGTGKPLRLLKKGSAERQPVSEGFIWDHGEAELRQGLDQGGGGRYQARGQWPGLLCQWPRSERGLCSRKGRARCEVCSGRSVPQTG